jgi:hypothetical protein
VVVVGSACTFLGPWLRSGTEPIDPLHQGQGLATVVHADGSTTIHYDGLLTPPPEKKDAGWDHVGDPGSRQGYVFEPYQYGTGSASSKLFHVIAPDGTGLDYLHALAGGEAMNNSFAAISPDGQWMVSGEWGTMNRLLVFPTPVLNPATAPTGGSLSLQTTIRLNVSVRDVQGCEFVTATRLICASDSPDPVGSVPRKALFHVDLARALDGATVDGTVTALGTLPLESACAPTGSGSWPSDFEVEGVDVDPTTGMVRVVVLSPGACVVSDSKAIRYRIPA